MEMIFVLWRETAKSVKFTALKKFELYSKYKTCHLPLQTSPLSPVNPVGQGGQVAPVPGAGTSVHVASLKHDNSLQPSTSFSQWSPLYAVFRKEQKT